MIIQSQVLTQRMDQASLYNMALVNCQDLSAWTLLQLAVYDKIAHVSIVFTSELRKSSVRAIVTIISFILGCWVNCQTSNVWRSHSTTR